MCLMSIQFSISRSSASLKEKQSQLSFDLQMYPSCKKALGGTKVQVTVTGFPLDLLKGKSAGDLIKCLSTSLHFLTPSITAKCLKTKSGLQWDFVAHIHNQQQLLKASLKSLTGK